MPHFAGAKSEKPNLQYPEHYKGEVSSYKNRFAVTTGKALQPGAPSSEIIQFAGFLSDYDPSLIFVLTYDTERTVSYLKVLKIHRREEKSQRTISFAEVADKRDLIDSVRTNIIEKGMQNQVAFSGDNYQVQFDPDKKQMKISKRGQATIAMKGVDLPIVQ